MMKTDQLKELKTELVKTRSDIGKASRLSKLYNYRPLLAKDIDKVIKVDWWTSGEFLTDVVVEGKQGYLNREPVAFLLLCETNVRHIEYKPIGDLFVSCFAMKYWYDIEIAAKWADYRITKAAEEINRIDRIIWPVDEYDTPLQCMLRELGYKATESCKETQRLHFVR